MLLEIWIVSIGYIYTLRPFREPISDNEHRNVQHAFELISIATNDLKLNEDIGQISENWHWQRKEYFDRKCDEIKYQLQARLRNKAVLQ